LEQIEDLLTSAGRQVDHHVDFVNLVAERATALPITGEQGDLASGVLLSEHVRGFVFTRTATAVNHPTLTSIRLPAALATVIDRRRLGPPARGPGLLLMPPSSAETVVLVEPKASGTVRVELVMESDPESRPTRRFAVNHWSQLTRLISLEGVPVAVSLLKRFTSAITPMSSSR